VPTSCFSSLALQDNGDKAGAETERKKGLELVPDWPEKAQKRAWKMATTAVEMELEPMQALFLARQACQDRDDRPEALDVLAAAYAAAGGFKEAAVNAEQALQLAEAEHKETLAHEIRQRLALFKEQKPFVQQQAKP
jgi:Flp pilus assembly protein TadD